MRALQQPTPFQHFSAKVSTMRTPSTFQKTWWLCVCVCRVLVFGRTQIRDNDEIVSPCIGNRPRFTPKKYTPTVATRPPALDFCTCLGSCWPWRRSALSTFLAREARINGCSQCSEINCSSTKSGPSQHARTLLRYLAAQSAVLA